MTPTEKAIFDAAERLNRANVSEAQNAAHRAGQRLYRDRMTSKARALDEAFQAHYDAARPVTNGPQPIPRMSERLEIPSSAIGFTLKMSEETKREIEEIDRKRAMAAFNARNFLMD